MNIKTLKEYIKRLPDDMVVVVACEGITRKAKTLGIEPYQNTGSDVLVIDTNT